MSGRFFMKLAFPCSDRNASWQGPMRLSGIVGNDIRIPTLKKSARAKLGADIHRRSQLPTGFHSPCDMESGGLPSGSSGHWRTKKREDLWRDRFMAYPFPLCAEYRVQRVHLRAFLEQLGRHYRRRGAMLIQDNASYHKDKDIWSWFKSHRDWLEVHQLPAHCPELNPTERLWQHTRKTGTHNRFFATVTELAATVTRVFTDMQRFPMHIEAYLAPFC